MAETLANGAVVSPPGTIVYIHDDQTLSRAFLRNAPGVKSICQLLLFTRFHNESFFFAKVVEFDQKTSPRIRLRRPQSCSDILCVVCGCCLLAKLQPSQDCALQLSKNCSNYAEDVTNLISGPGRARGRSGSDGEGRGAWRESSSSQSRLKSPTNDSNLLLNTLVH